MKVQGQRKTILKLKAKFMSQKAIESRIKKRLEGCKDQCCVTAKGSSCRCVKTVDPKCPGVFYEVKKKLAFYAALEVFQTEAYVDSD